MIAGYVSRFNQGQVWTQRTFLERTECLFVSVAPCRRAVPPWFFGPESPNTSLQSFCRPNTCNGWAKFTLYLENNKWWHTFIECSFFSGHWGHKFNFCNTFFFLSFLSYVLAGTLNNKKNISLWHSSCSFSGKIGDVPSNSTWIVIECLLVGLYI